MGKKKPKMGRPPLPPDERRTKPIKVRVTATEYRLLERETAAERKGRVMGDA